MAFVWTRTKTWIPGEVLTAADLNGEFDSGLNTFNAAMNTSTGHEHDGTDSSLISYLNLNDKPSDFNGVIFSITGNLAVAADVSPLLIPAFEAFTITKVLAIVGTAPTGAAIILDINVDGTSIWDSGVSRITIPDGSTSVITQTSIINASVTEGQVITLDVDQVGSTTPGARLTVILVYQVTL